MLRKGSGCLFMFGLIALVGCGPSLKEQLTSAEARYLMESDRLKEMSKEVQDKRQAVVAAQCLEAVGTNMEILADESESGKVQTAEDATRAMERTLKRYKKMDLVEAYYDRARKEGTPEYNRLQAKMREFEAYREFEKQKEIVQKAKQEVEDLRKQLGS